MELEERIRSRLSTGLIIPSYIEMCKIIEVKPTKGKGRDYHFRELERYCKFEREKYKQKITVTEVYDEPLPKIDNRATGKNSKYDDLMDKILINMLIENGAMDESTSRLMNEYLCFFTSEYKKLYNVGYKRYSEINNMSKGLVMEYQQKIRDVVVGCLNTSLKRLKRNNIITYEQNIIIRSSDFKTDYANEKMIREIKKYEKKVYEEMDIIPFHRSNPNINSKFKSQVCQHFEIASYWNVHSIKLLDKYIDKVEEDKDELIRRFIKSVHENTINRESTDSFGNKFKPYSSPKFKDDLNTLEKLIWKLPGDYISEYDKEQEDYKLMEELFGDVVPF